VVLVIMTILTGFVARSVRSSALSPIDRSLGFIFGLLRGAFILSLAFLLLDFVQPADRPTWVKEAKSAPYLEQGAELLRTVLPEPLKSKSTTAAQEVIQTVTPALEADRALRALTNPTTPPAATPDSPPAYTQGDRTGLDRLIGTQR
jgi:membrane protein required for colicin V production